MPVPPLKRARRAARSFLVRALFVLLAWLPLGAALGLGALLGRLAWLVAPRERRRMLENLAFALPERTEEERRAIARKSLVHLGQLAMEIVAVRAYDERLDGYVTFTPGSEDVLRRAIARGKGVIFVAGHIGNWELLARRIASFAKPNAVVARRNADPALNALMERFRQGGEVKTLWREDPSTGRELIRLFRRGGTLGILVDQDTRVQGVFVPFFGRLAFTPRAVGDLALRFGTAVVVGACRRRGRQRGGGHELDVIELTYDASPADPQGEVERLTAEAVAYQERAIRSNPEEWVWMHARWKTRPEREAAVAKVMPNSSELSKT